MKWNYVYIILLSMYLVYTDTNFIYNNEETCNLTGSVEYNDEYIFYSRDMDICEPRKGYKPAESNPKITTQFNSTRYITYNNAQNACIYYYRDNRCKDGLWNDCLGQQERGKTNITFIKEGKAYIFENKCYCYLRRGVCY